ncbi:sigma 54-interacting transcriptional regulator [Lacunimicrobium album]
MTSTESISPTTSNPSKPSDDEAFLLVSDGQSWGKMYKLNPAQVATIGRGSSNRILILDDMCSRNHAEIFHIDTGWFIRDLKSRNGTLVNGSPIDRDFSLSGGEEIRIGSYQLTFELSVANFQQRPPSSGADRTTEIKTGDDSAKQAHEIVSRRSKTRYHDPDAFASNESRQKFGEEFSRLYKLALKMSTVSTTQELSRMVLNHLMTFLGVDIGAVLLFPEKRPGGREPILDGPLRSQRLAVVAYESKEEMPYQRVSASLSEIVFDTGEAILARDIATDSRLATRDSLGQIQAKSVICTPIRRGEQVFGLIHLYTTNLDNQLTTEDLEYTLALTDQFAQILLTMRDREVLEKGLQAVVNENRHLKAQLELESEIIGCSPEIERLKRDIQQIAETDAIVLVRGESGAGKELVARAIHYNSHRKANAFVCLNCAALSESLLESELFGHEKGSFTGATGRKIGKFEAADQGTLFLDEVGEMSLSIQAKFLRVLEGHAFERVGGNAPIKADVRLVAATNRDLESAVREGHFRKDLYFRLHVVELVVPSLYERRDDILILADHFVERIAEKNGRIAKHFEPDAVQMLLEYTWPGNIRELKHTVERAFLLSRSDKLRGEDLKFSQLEEDFSSAAPRPAIVSGDSAGLSLEAIEQQHILTVLDNQGWNKSRAAQILGIERSTLDRKLKKYGLNKS